MRPSPACLDVPDGCLVQAVFSREGGEALGRILNFRSQVAVLLVRSPALSDHVLHVVFVRAAKEMIRVHATWVVAPMADVHPAGNSPLAQLVAESMCRIRKLPTALAIV